jgi:RimJ/RimL family protein N-acetyltransferase
MKYSEKERICRSLPIETDNFIIRLCNRNDIDTLSKWPAYPWPYNAFQFSFNTLSTHEKNTLFKMKVDQIDRITLVIDHLNNKAIGYVALVNIDWHNRKSQNMSIRIHPNWCDRGIGTSRLKSIADWWFRNEMLSLHLDVAASNRRAVKCYLKVGFRITGEFWKKEDDLINVNLDASKYQFLKEYIRFKNGFPELKFLLMEINKE